MIRLFVGLTSLVVAAATAGCNPAATDGDGEGEGDVGEGEGDGDVGEGEGDGDVGEGEGDGDVGEGEGEGDVGEGEGEGDIGEGEGEGEGEGDIGDRLTLIVDEASRVTTAVGAEGGSLAIGGNLLVVPANALAETLTISMALAEASELPGASLVALEPDGLVFLAPATLTLADARADAWVVRFDGDGVGPHLVPRARDATVTVEIGHFSGAGVGSGAAPTFAPPTAATTALDALARIEIAESASGTPNVAGRAAAVRPWLTSLRADIARVESDVAAWDRALAEANELITQIDQSGLDDDNNLGVEFAPVADGLHAALRKALARIAADRRRVALAAHDWELELEVERIVFPRIQGRLPVQVNDPFLSSAALARDSLVDVVFHDVGLRETPDPDDPNLLVAGRVTATFGGETIPNPPLTLSVLVGQGDATGGVTGDVVTRDADGRFELTVRPNDGASRVVVVLNGVFDGFETYAPEASNVASKETAPVRLVLRASAGTDGFASVLPAESVAMEAVLLQGDGAQETGAPGRAVRFSVDGPGFIQPDATTDGSGTARATFFAESDETTSTVHATVDPGDGPPLTATLEISVSDVRVTLEPALSIVNPGAEVELTAELTGPPPTTNFGLVFGSDGGSFTSTPGGVTWTAPATPGRYQLRATSGFDARANAVADLVVLVGGSTLRAEVVIEEQPCEGPLVRDIIFRAFEGSTPVPDATLRVTRDGFVIATLRTDANGEAHYGRRPPPATQLFVEWLDGSTLLGVVDVMAEYPADHGDPCKPCPLPPNDACPSSRVDFDANFLIEDEVDDCRCFSLGCCPTDRCYHNGDC